MEEVHRMTFINSQERSKESKSDDFSPEFEMGLCAGNAGNFFALLLSASYLAENFFFFLSTWL